jgi:gliding motility-associated-like protein
LKQKNGLILFLFCLITGLCAAQEAFDCNGRIFRVLERQGGTVFQEVFLDPQTRSLETLDLQFYRERKINGIAYHPTQNLIYGVLLGEKYRLCRIDAQYELEVIRELPLPEDMLFVSGDVSPDERYLVLLGFSQDKSTNLIALVDLTAPDFPTQLIETTTTDLAVKAIYCADIAFHPTNGKLFGFDHLSGRLITIDIQKKRIDNTSYPPSDVLQGNVPSIFFNAQGELYGVGSSHPGYTTNRNLYHFDVGNGAVSLLEQLNFETNQDGCSCPFKVKLLNRVSERQAAPCTELTFRFTIINRTNRIQANLSFTDTLPAYMEIREIGALPFSGQIISGVGSNLLDIRSIELPIGVDSFEIKVMVAPDAPRAHVYNSAYLDGVIYQDENTPRLIASDDPETPQPNDPTWFQVEPLQVKFSESEVYLCAEGSVELRPKVPGGLAFQWNTGAGTPAITVNSPGLYVVTVTTSCGKAAGKVRVTNNELKLDLGPDQVVEKGELIDIRPDIYNEAAITGYSWNFSIGNSDCQNCAEQSFAALTNEVVHLEITDEHGCTARDELQVQVKPFRLFAPTAFSPNGDGINDQFYLQSSKAYSIRHFRIFDRWGSLLFQGSELATNDAQLGWDGKSRDQPLRTGVYIWMAEIVNLAGESELIKGEVSLVR